MVQQLKGAPLGFLATFFERFKKHPSPVDICINSLGDLDRYQFQQLYSAEYSTERLPVMFDNIEIYIARMRSFIESSERKSSLQAYQFNQEIRVIHLQDFLVSEKGLSLHLGETFDLFRLTSLEFFKSLDGPNDEVAERNRQIVGRFTSSLMTIIEFIHALQMSKRLVIKPRG
jgi:hypothetical protein